MTSRAPTTAPSAEELEALVTSAVLAARARAVTTGVPEGELVEHLAAGGPGAAR